MSAEREPEAGDPRLARMRGLCPKCAHVQVVTTAKGSTFLLCRRAKDDARYAKYPPQPVAFCAGHEKLGSRP